MIAQHKNILVDYNSIKLKQTKALNMYSETWLQQQSCLSTASKNMNTMSDNTSTKEPIHDTIKTKKEYLTAQMRN
ncbi:20683_t:CDS:2 [Gigaspora margarita]|uniref:20683_t:CDS:1 n=1 Tax=Gigaspora margarita TaxID=4874 RepID=A0ABN7UU78_GIGMA|nr:20683_t:CDS:2 [Gigaspora margarita]